MTTPLHNTLKRALTINGREYVVALTDDGMKLTLKGKRNGLEIAWASLVNGEAALATALQASVGVFVTPPKTAVLPDKTIAAKPVRRKRSVKKAPRRAKT